MSLAYLAQTDASFESFYGQRYRNLKLRWAGVCPRSECLRVKHRVHDLGGWVEHLIEHEYLSLLKHDEL